MELLKTCGKNMRGGWGKRNGGGGAGAGWAAF